MRGWPKITDQDLARVEWSQSTILSSEFCVRFEFLEEASASERKLVSNLCETKVKVGKAGTKGASQNAPSRRDGAFIRRALADVRTFSPSI